jgi:hypothetical protein
MRVWVTREKKECPYDCGIWFAKPKKRRDRYDFGGKAPVFRNLYRSSQFKKDFGFTPRKGSCKQYELSLKEIK